MNRKKATIITFSFLLAAVLFSPTATEIFADNGIATLRETSKAFSKVAKTAVPAVVSIQVETIIELSSGHGSSPFGYHSPFDDDFFEFFFGGKQPRRSPQKQRQVGQGSGFIISPEGYILTNNHVVENADKITVILSDGREFDDVEIIGTDPKSEVAVIKIKSQNLPVIELGDSDVLEIGEWVIAVGNPFGLTETVTVGVVSAKGRQVGITEEGYEDFIQTDAAINPGNSGGPLLNLDGKAIGINSAIYSRSGGYMGIGFAIPINMARNIKDQLVATGKVTRGYIGISMNRKGITPDLAESFGLKDNSGVLISQVLEDTPAEKAGLESGDIILKMDDKIVKDNESFRNDIALKMPGTKVNLTIFRNGKRKEIAVKIGSLSDSILASGVSEIGQKLGLSVQDLTRELAERFGYNIGEGVIVTEVEAASNADRAGIEPGMLILSINRRNVNSIKDFNATLQKADADKKALFLLRNERYAWWEVLSWD